jgi:hypothetical protein
MHTAAHPGPAASSPRTLANVRTTTHPLVTAGAPASHPAGLNMRQVTAQMQLLLAARRSQRVAERAVWVAALHNL